MHATLSSPLFPLAGLLSSPLLQGSPGQGQQLSFNFSVCFSILFRSQPPKKGKTQKHNRAVSKSSVGPGRRVIPPFISGCFFPPTCLTLLNSDVALSIFWFLFFLFLNYFLRGDAKVSTRHSPQEKKPKTKSINQKAVLFQTHSWYCSDASLLYPDVHIHPVFVLLAGPSSARLTWGNKQALIKHPR